LALSIYRNISKVLSVKWGERIVVYNTNSGSTYLLENMPDQLIDQCFEGLVFNESIFLQMMLEHGYTDEQFVSDCITNFIKMGLLEKVED